MELTKLLFNTLSVSANNLKSNTDISSSKNESKFEDYMNNTSSSNKNVKNVSNKNEKQIKTDRKNKDYSDKTVKADKIDKSNSDEKIDSKKIENKNSQTANSKDDDVKTKEISTEEKEQIVQKETELKEEIAQILGVEVQDVENILKQLGITVFDLKDSKNLLDFLQAVFEASDPSDLLTITGIKDMITEVKKVVEEQTVGFEDLLEDFDFETLEQIKEIEMEDKQVISEKSKDNAEIESTEESADNFSKQGIVKNENTSLREKNSDNSEEAQTEQVQTETSEIKTSENMDMQNDFSQQGFRENTNANKSNFENNNLNADKSNGMSAVTFDNVSKALSQVVSKNAAMRNVNTADVINQIIEKFKVGIIKENVSEIKITLKPDYLGDVALKIVSENGIVSAQFTAENQRVKEIIEANFNNLKNMLDEQGVQVSALSVSVGSDNTEERHNFESEQTKSSKRINNIINNASEEEEEIAEYIDEGDVLQTSVNYTA